jgi:hypothetical protein
VTPVATGYISTEGSIRLAKAMWWMLARIAGWDGSTAKGGNSFVEEKENIVVEEFHKQGILPETELLVYPNPASGYITIASASPEENIYTIYLTNVSGQVILNKKINIIGGKYLLDISNIRNGYYILRIDINNRVKLVKIIKQ